MKKRLLVLAMTSAVAAPATAQESAWRFQVSPYLWMPHLHGDVQPLANGPRVHTRMSFLSGPLLGATWRF